MQTSDATPREVPGGPDAAELTRLVTLGRVEVLAPGPERRRVFGPGKPAALLSYLALSGARSAPRDHLLDLLWADLGPESAAHAFRQTIWLIRKRLGETALATGRGQVQLTLALSVDSQEFLDAVEEGELERAVDLYQGDFLADLALPGGADFEYWADSERYRHRLLFLRAAEGLVKVWLESGRQRDGLRLARRVRDSRPLSQRAWRLLLEAHLSARDIGTAMIEADCLRARLTEEERYPDPATEALLDRIDGDAGGGDGEREGSGDGVGLVAELVGRTPQFSAILEAWECSRGGMGQHVHVTAPSGLGKTRLLRDVHARLRATGSRAVLLRAHQGERQIPFSLAGDLAGAFGRLPGAPGVSPETAATLVALHPPLSASFNVQPDPQTGDEAVRRRIVALIDVLQAVAEDRPTAVLIDDLHWADEVSRHILRGVIAKLEGHPVLFVTAARPVSEVAVQVDRTAIITLPPLADDQVAGLVGSLAGLPDLGWAADLLRGLASSTGGSPLMILETLQLGIESGWLEMRDGRWACTDEDRMRDELREGVALRHRIEHLDRDARRLLLFLAVAGTPLSVEGLASLDAWSESAVRADLQGLEARGGLVQRNGLQWTTGHDEVAEAVQALAGANAIREVHRSLGTFWVSAGPGAQNLARSAHHFRAGGHDEGLDGALRRWVESQRRAGDRRSVPLLVASLLGCDVTDVEVGIAVSRLPVGTRLRHAIPFWPAALGLGLIMTALATVFLTRSPPVEPELTLIVGAMDSSLGTPPRQVPVDVRNWVVSIPVRMNAAEPVPQLPDGLRGVDVAQSPDGRRWAFARDSRDNGNLDLYVGDRDTVIRLTFDPADDGGPDWSPDGRQIVFQTTRWQTGPGYDLAVADVATGAIRPLVRTEAWERSPRWSPDGTRVAFARIGNNGWHRACTVAVDGLETERCQFSSDSSSVVPVAWYDANHLVLQVSDGEGNGSYELAMLGSDRSRRLGPAGRSMGVSRDGKWTLRRQSADGFSTPIMVLAPLERPEQGRRIDFGAGRPEDYRVFFGTPVHRALWLERVSIETPPGSQVSGVPFSLPVTGTDRDGHRVEVLAKRWSSSDPEVAEVDSRGMVYPHRPGRVVLTVTAGGWRTASVEVTIGPATVGEVTREDWAEGLRRWVPFEEPRPDTTRGPDRILALWNRGDKNHFSGAYSRRTWDARQGLGVEALVSAPTTGRGFEHIRILLMEGVDEALLDAWGHRRTVPGDGVRPACTVRYPQRHVGAARWRFLFSTVDAILVDASAAYGSGRWFRLRLQVFPDGTCGLALDGRMVARTSDHLPLTGRYRLILQGSDNWGSGMLVGPLEVWEGIRTDVDWSRLPSHPPE